MTQRVTLKMGNKTYLVSRRFISALLLLSRWVPLSLFLGALLLCFLSFGTLVIEFKKTQRLKLETNEMKESINTTESTIESMHVVEGDK